MRFSTTFSVIITVLASSAVADAADSAFRRAVQSRSLESALGQNRVRRFLTLRNRTTNEAVREQLLTTLSLSPTELSELPASASDTSALLAQSEEFRLQVSDGGTRGHFRKRRAAGAGAGTAPVRRPALDELEPSARRFIQRDLAWLIRLGSGEALSAWNVTHEIAGVGSVSGGQTSELLSSTITFVRTIGGIPVVGPSSRVHVSYAPSGDLLGVEFDWPELKEVDDEPTVAVAQLKARIGALQRARGGLASQGALECGYALRDTDAGAMLQPACVSRYRVDRGGVEQTYADIVPLSAQISSDARWPEAAFLRAAESGKPVKR